jgi:hypothetical protein
MSIHIDSTECDDLVAAIDPPASRPVSNASARCSDGNGTLTPLFFSDELVDIARAKAICARCESSATCLAGALERAEPWGVWGGELLESGRIVAVKRPRGRPAVRPRPTLVIDEIGTIRALDNVDDKTEFEVAIRVA